jgi:hypothetical protein
METKLKCNQEERKAAINSIRAELEETMKHRVEDVLAYTDQRKRGLREKIDTKMKQTQLN